MQKNIKQKPSHPGKIFYKDFIEPSGCTIIDIAKRLNIHRKTLSEFVNGKSRCSTIMAIRIGLLTKTNPIIWLNIQTQLDLWYAEQKICNVKPFPKLLSNKK